MINGDDDENDFKGTSHFSLNIDELNDSFLWHILKCRYKIITTFLCDVTQSLEPFFISVSGWSSLHKSIIFFVDNIDSHFKCFILCPLHICLR